MGVIAQDLQYLDWFFEGNDLVVLSRTAFDDGLGGAHDCHDANFVTFHRVKEFRREASDPSDNDSALTVRARELARRLTIIDTHVDLPSILAERWHDVSMKNSRSNFDYVRANAGGLNVAFMSIYVSPRLEGTPKAKERAELQIAAVRRMVAEWPDKFDLVRSPAEITQKSHSAKVLLAMGLENGAPIQGDLSQLAYFHSLGIRYITLAHANWNHIADASYDPVRHWNGLSPFGRQVVEEMNRLGIMVDVSHLTDSAAIQAIRISRVPVIASHSSCRAFTPGFERNMSDELIIALAQKGGVIQISFASEFVNDSVRYAYMLSDSAVADSIRRHGWEPRSPEAGQFKREYLQQHPPPFATLEDVAAHIDHVRKLVGIDFVGIGSDFDGVGDTLPPGLKDVSGYPNLIAALLKRGYTEADIAKVCGANLLRVWSEVERAARDQMLSR
jgi:membrane dipeptidase